ncbi:MAG: VOC family protein [Deltaproteobacteria bacterium]
MKPTPAGWPRISAGIYYLDPGVAIDWLCKAFGFEVRLKVEGEGGRIEHSELTYGDGLIMVGTAGPSNNEKDAWRQYYASPRELSGKCTQGLAVFVDDADAHCARARAAGAKIFREPKTDDYGEDYWADRTYGALDPEGHQWFFMQRIRNPGTPS